MRGLPAIRTRRYLRKRNPPRYRPAGPSVAIDIVKPERAGTRSKKWLTNTRLWPTLGSATCRGRIQTLCTNSRSIAFGEVLPTDNAPLQVHLSHVRRERGQFISNHYKRASCLVTSLPPHGLLRPPTNSHSGRNGTSNLFLVSKIQPALSQRYSRTTKPFLGLR
jgi:hypothetical protein